MREVPVTRHEAIPLADFERLRSQLRALPTLAEVLAWGRAQLPPRTVTEIVTQDEYTHDVVMKYDEGLYLVFDTT